MNDIQQVVDHRKHTAYTDPGRYAALLDQVPTADLDQLSSTVRNVIVHYRASGEELPAENLAEIHARRLVDKLALDQQRHAGALTHPRPVQDRVQGCCRDHTLLCVGLLRQHGVPARSRVGFADYFEAGWHHDHVIPEFWNGTRWQRFEPELDGPSALLADPRDIPAGSGFETAAEVWLGHRRAELDVQTYGVDRDVPGERGAWFVRNYVLLELAHRFGDELLLWDNWGVMDGPGAGERDLDLIDEVAELSVAADQGDQPAQARLLQRYREDDRLHPGPVVLRVALPEFDLVAESVPA